MKLHPYALILGVGIGIMVLFALRHPLFAILATALSVLGFDLAFKKKLESDNHKEDDNNDL